MTDLREGRIQAYLDGEMPPSEREEFENALRADPELPPAVEAQRERRALVETSLALLDQPIELGAARDALASRLAGKGIRSTPAQPGSGGGPRLTPKTKSAGGHLWGLPMGLGRAAALVLIGASAATAAVPGSPIRNFVVGLTADEPVPEVQEAFASDEVSRERSEIRMPVPEDGLTVRLLDLPEPWEVTVRLVPESFVLVQAAPGTSYTTNPNGMDVRTGGTSVLIGIPATGDAVTVLANDTRIVHSEGGTFRVLGTDETQGVSEFVIQSNHLTGR